MMDARETVRFRHRLLHRHAWDSTFAFALFAEWTAEDISYLLTYTYWLLPGLARRSGQGGATAGSLGLPAARHFEICSESYPYFVSATLRIEVRSAAPAFWLVLTK